MDGYAIGHAEICLLHGGEKLSFVEAAIPRMREVHDGGLRLGHDHVTDILN